MEKPCVLVVGNLTEGYRFIGPFEDFDAAVQFSEGVDCDNWVATLEVPSARLIAAAPELLAAAKAVAAIGYFVDETYCLTSEAAKAIEDLKAAVKKEGGE
jgi:hypothetical protein